MSETSDRIYVFRLRWHESWEGQGMLVECTPIVVIAGGAEEAIEKLKKHRLGKHHANEVVKEVKVLAVENLARVGLT